MEVCVRNTLRVYIADDDLKGTGNSVLVHRVRVNEEEALQHLGDNIAWRCSLPLVDGLRTSRSAIICEASSAFTPPNTAQFHPNFFAANSILPTTNLGSFVDTVVIARSSSDAA